MSVRWGVLSTGWIAGEVVQGSRPSSNPPVASTGVSAGSEEHARGASQRFHAVGSRDLGRAKAFADEHGLRAAYGSYEELLADPEIDAIYNPLPNSMHIEWTIAALEAGKHVLCEKPFSRHPADVERAVQTASERNLVLAEAFMWRHHPQIARLRALIDAGEIGEVQVVRCGFGFRTEKPEDIRLDPSLEGGSLMDSGSYCVSACRLMAGTEPERVYAEAVTGGKGVDVRAVATLRFPDGVLGRFDCGISYNGGDSIEVVGTLGSIFLDDPWIADIPNIEVRTGFLGREIRLIEGDPGQNPYELELDDFELAIRGDGRSTEELATELIAQSRALAALQASIESGTPQSVVSGRSTSPYDQSATRSCA
jgi:predicted dehydrogenase